MPLAVDHNSRQSGRFLDQTRGVGPGLKLVQKIAEDEIE